MLNRYSGMGGLAIFASEALFPLPWMCSAAYSMVSAKVAGVFQVGGVGMADGALGFAGPGLVLRLVHPHVDHWA